MIELINEDSFEELDKFPENYFSSCVTDPPYGLTSITKRFGKEGSAPAQEGKDGRFSRLSRGFLGETWDGTGIENNPEFWKKVLRTLKPGGYLLAFSSPRTQHRMTTAIEEAGFEIRDVITWIYSTGFPKSLDISKQIDKMETGITRGKAGKVISDNSSMENVNYERTPKGAPISEDGVKWEGWGTALKPASEPVVMCRKPISEESVAKNILKWGVGGINIDESRISLLENEVVPINKLEKWSGFGQEVKPDYIRTLNTKGRWPSNFMIDDYTAEELGLKSRYFYCPKPNKKEKGDNSHPTTKPLELLKYLVNMVTPENGLVLDPFAGSFTTALACLDLDVSCIAIEKSKEYFDLYLPRIKEYMEKSVECK